MRLFVGGLSYDTTEEDLRDYFTTYTTSVAEAVVIRDKEQGNRSKGFGFVTVDTNRTTADVIAEFHKSKLGGRNITVNEAKPQVNPRDRHDRHDSGRSRH